MLSCSCQEWDGEPGTWAYYEPDFFEPFDLKRRKRCCSCEELIDLGADCLIFPRIRAPCTDIEERICGEEIPIATLFMCGRCGEIYLNLKEIGYCPAPYDEMTEALREYWEITGFKPITTALSR